MGDRHVALYARVSTEQQARDATIASQLAALREHIAADGRQPTRRGSARWYASTVRGMLANTAYIGRAVYGHSRFLPARPRLRHPKADEAAQAAFKKASPSWYA